MASQQSNKDHSKDLNQQKENMSIITNSKNSRPSAAVSENKRSIQSAIKSLINEEFINNNHQLNKNQIYQSCKIQKTLQATYLRPESAQKVIQNGMIVQFNELSVHRKSNRSKSVGTNIFLSNDGGEIIEDKLADDQILIKKKVSITNRSSRDQTNFINKDQMRFATPKKSGEELLKDKQSFNESKQKDIRQSISNQIGVSVYSKNKRSSSFSNLNGNISHKKSILLNGSMNKHFKQLIDTKDDRTERQARLDAQQHKQIIQSEDSPNRIVVQKQNYFTGETNQQNSMNDITDSQVHNQTYFIEETFQRKARMEEIRDNYYINLKNMIQIADKDVLILRTKSMFDSAFNTMKKVVDEYDQIIKELKGRVFKLNNENAELETTNDWLKRLNQQLDKQKVRIAEDSELILRQNKDLSCFKDNYILMQTKFPNLNLDKLIVNYEIVDRKAFEYLARVNTLEDDKAQLERQQRDSKEQIKTLKQEVEDYRLKRANLNGDPYYLIGYKKGKDNNAQWNGQSLEKNLCQMCQKDSNYVKDSQLQREYNQLFNKILEIFNSLLQKQSILSLNSNDCKCNLDNPIDILSTIEKMVQFSNSEQLSSEMKRTIIAANKLYRLCYDESSASIFNSQTQYDCEIIYNKVYSYLNSLKNHINSLKKQLASYKLINKS